MIYIKKDGVNKWRVNNYTFSDPQMGIRTISLTVNHPLDWVDGEPVEVPDFAKVYVEYEGEQYFIANSKPTAEKDTSGISYKYTLSFKGSESDLERRKIRNLAETGVDKFISQGTSFSLYADINQFAQLLRNNLKYYFGDKWNIVLSTTANDSVLITVNNMFIWDLLVKTYELYGLRWFIRGNTIYIGHEPDYIEHVFDYGVDGGLVKITRTAQSDRVANRLAGVGSSRNVPMNYFTNRHPGFPVDPNPISGDVNIKNIMPKVFRDSVKTGTLPYIDYVEDSNLVLSDGVKEDALEPNEDIFPSIAGVEVPGLGRIDQIIAVESVDTDTPDDEGYSATFDVWVKDIQFDLKDDIYTSTEEAKISFTSGVLSGYEFIILAQGGSRVVVEDTSKTYNGVQSKYKITLIKSSEEYEASGRMIPNSSVNASPNDSFVIYDIEMPQSYVELAERRVQEWLESKLDELKKENPTYAIEPMDMFFEDETPESDGKTIKEKLKSGNKLSINNTKITDGIQELHINQVTIQYGGLLPKYTFVVTDKVNVGGSSIQRLQSSFDAIANRQYYTEMELNDILNKVSRRYLSKISPDTAKEVITFLKGLTSNGLAKFIAGLEADALSKFNAGLISAEKSTFNKGLQIGENFVPGIMTGIGGNIDGKGNAELESLILRRWLEVPELRYNRTEISIGDKWRAAGAGIFESVDTENRIIKLKLEDGEIGSFRYDDICMGIYHSMTSSENATSDYDDSKGNRRFAGFATSYFRIIQVMDERCSTLRYELRPASANYPNPIHPSQFMTSAAYGNFSDKGRQTSVYETRTYQRYLRNVNNWEFSINNIAAQFGDLSNLNVFGLEMAGYSAYLNNVYFTGIIYQLEQQIQDEIAKNQVGAKNLLREYDIRFAFKYWGGTGQFVEIDIDNLLVLLQTENDRYIITENGILIDLS